MLALAVLTENTLMVLIIILMLSVLALVLLRRLKLLSVFSPSVSLIKPAVGTLLKYKWLFWIPFLLWLSITLLNLIRLYLYYHNRDKSILEITPSIWYDNVLIRVLTFLFNSSSGLDYAYHKVISAHFPYLPDPYYWSVLISVVIIILTYLFGRHVKEENMPTYRHLYQILLIFLLVDSLALWFFFHSKMPDEIGAYGLGVLISVGQFIIWCAPIGFISLAEGGLLVGLKKVLRQEETGFPAIFNETVGVFSKLFVFNLLLVIIRLVIPHGLIYVQFIRHTTQDGSPYWFIGHLFSFLFNIFVLLIPFIIIQQRINTWSALRQNIRLFSRHYLPLLGYLILTCGFFFVIGLVGYLTNFFSFYPWTHQAIGFACDFLRCLGAIIIMILTFSLYLQLEPDAPAGQNVTSKD